MKQCGTLTSLLASLLFIGCAATPEQPEPEPVLNEARLSAIEAQLSQCLHFDEDSLRQRQEHTRQLKRQNASLKRIEKNLSSPPPKPLQVQTIADAKECDASTPQTLENKLLIGAREQVWIADIEIALPARVDTGAQTASLDARNIHLFERDGDKWVRFDVVHPQSGSLISLERELERMTRVLQSNNDEGERRPVVKLPIAIGPMRQTAEFTLSDRAHLDYQILVGRNILRDMMLVDVSRSNLLTENTDISPVVVDEETDTATPEDNQQGASIE